MAKLSPVVKGQKKHNTGQKRVRDRTADTELHGNAALYS